MKRSKKLRRTKSWNVRGFATEESKMIESAEQGSERTRHGGKSRVVGERGGGTRMRSGRVRMDRKEEGGSRVPINSQRMPV